MGESEEKQPKTATAVERIRMMASEAYGVAVGRGSQPFSLPGTPDGDACVAWAASMGFAQAAMAPSDPAAGAFVRQRLSTLHQALPTMVRIASRGLPEPGAERDRARLALSYGGHPEFGESQEMLAAIEARRMVSARGFPKYWSQEQKSMVEEGMAAFMDRTISESLRLAPEKRREAYAKMGKALGMLGSNCDMLAMFCQSELDRAGAAPERLEQIAAGQEELVGCARDMMAMPSLDRSVRNIALAAAAGTAMAAAAPVAAAAAMPVVQSVAVALALPALKAAAAGMGKLAFGYGLSASCSALAMSAGSFLGMGFTAPTRLDELGGVSSTLAAIAPDTAVVKAAEAADARLCAGFFNMSDEILTQAQRKGFVEALGFARSRLVGSILGGGRVDVGDLPGIVGENLRSMPESELALLGQISEPSVAAAFLLDSETTSQRLDLLMLQKRLDYMGSARHELDLGPKAMEEARRLIIMRGEDGAASSLSMGDMAALAQRRIESLSPMGRRFASLCPRAQQAEFLSRLVERPLDAQRPDLDVAARLNEALKLGCARLERKSFIERKITGFVSKATKSLVDDPVRALRALAEWAFSSRSEQSFDFAGQSAKLAEASGGLALPGWLARTPSVSLRMSVASARHAQAEARAGEQAKGPAEDRLAQVPAEPARAVEAGLGKLAEKLRGARLERQSREVAGPAMARVAKA